MISDLTGPISRFVRPPDGMASAEVMKQIRGCGMITAFCSAHAWDWTGPGVDAIVRDVTRGLRHDAVVLLHDGGGDRSQTVEAIPRIARVAADRGLQAIRLAA